MTQKLGTTEVRRALAGLVRSDARSAAGADGKIDAGERYALSSLPQAAATALGDGELPVNAVVDRAMDDAAALWRKHGVGSGTTLSEARMKAIQAEDKTIGLWTRTAAQVVSHRKAPRGEAPRVSLVRADPGLRLTKRDDAYTISASAAVPVGTVFELVVDQHRFELRRAPGGIDAQRAVAPEGYGIELGATTHGDRAVKATLQIVRDPPGTLSTHAALTRARAGLVEYLQQERMHQADWKQYFPEGWDEAVARGVTAGIDTFSTPGAEGSSVIRKPDRYLFVGRGPFDLYTEVEVAKDDGRLLRALVEVD